MAWSDLLETADRAALATWPTPVTYTPGDGTTAAVVVNGVFSNASQLAQGDFVSVIGTAPTVFLRLDDLPTDPTVDKPTLTINGQNYNVDQPKVDGEGGVFLVLQRED